MKMRRLLTDFQVREQNQLTISSRGDYAVYELTKSGWTTLDALAHFSRVLNIPRQKIQHAGLKDRHAVTRQIVTIRLGPRRSWAEEHLSLTYLGQASRETGPADIVANQFEIVLRSLDQEAIDSALQAVPQLRNYGLPNYFDDQRFGSWFEGSGFVATEWIRENYERALWLAFAEHHPDDPADERAQKQLMRTHWKDWLTCKQVLDRSHRRSIVTFLCDKPQDFKGAWGIVNTDLRGLYLSALQSDLWNHAVSDLLEQHCRPQQLVAVTLKTGPVWFPQELEPSQISTLREIQLPLPSARIKPGENPWREFLDQSLQKRGWTLAALKVKFPRDRFFSRAQRPLWLSLDELQAEASPDELDAGRQKLQLRFKLPRGSYATMLVKRMWGAGSMLRTGLSLFEENE